MALAHPVNRIIIQESQDKGWDVLTEYFRNDSLECCRHGFQPKRHDHCYEYPPFCYECRLFLVVGMHADLVIPAEPVQKVVHLMPCDGGQHAIHKWQGKRVCDCDGIKLSIINAYPYLPVFLRDYDDGDEPCRPF